MSAEKRAIKREWKIVSLSKLIYGKAGALGGKEGCDLRSYLPERKW